MVLEEKSHTLKQSQVEAEVATKKMRLVSDQFYHLEATTSRKVADLDGIVAQQVFLYGPYKFNRDFKRVSCRSLYALALLFQPKRSSHTHEPRGSGQLDGAELNSQFKPSFQVLISVPFSTFSQHTCIFSAGIVPGRTPNPTPQAARLAHYELLEQDIDASILQLGAGVEFAAGAGGGAGAALALASSVPTAVRPRACWNPC